MKGHTTTELIGLSEEFELRALTASNPLEKAQWEVMAKDYRQQALRLALEASERSADRQLADPA